MSKRCEKCGRGSKKSASRSHSNIKTVKRQYINLQKKTIDGKDFYYLPVGKRAVVAGCIRVTYVPPRNPFYLWGGLIHEDVEISQLNDRVDPHSINIGAP